MKALTELKQDIEGAWESLADGWRHLGERASTALTRFKATSRPATQAEEDETDLFNLTSPRWGMLAGDVFEDENRVVVRLEAPGLAASDFDIRIDGNILDVRGEKRIERERGTGRYQLRECAYGSFQRRIPLPAAVDEGKVDARYRDGVLRVIVPKQAPTKPQAIQVKVRSA